MKFLCLLLFTLTAGATTFQRTSVADQMKEADGVIIGHFLKKKSIRLEDGRIATQMIFKMNKEFGLRSDFFGMDEVIVHYPGGTLEGMTTKVDGVPAFIPGEKVALLTKSVDNRYWGLNLGYGSFKVINYGKDVLLVNSLFPEDPKSGQIPAADFEQLVKEVKGSRLKVVEVMTIQTQEQKRAPSSVSEGKNRTLASKTEPEENQEDAGGLATYWLVAGLGLLGGCYRFLKQKSHS